MAHFYSRKEMLDILRKLDISPKDGAINTKEFAKVLTWRAKEESNIDFTYRDTTIRSRITTGSLIPIGGKNSRSRYNTYKFEDAFSLPLFPRRGIGQGKQETPVS